MTARVGDMALVSNVVLKQRSDEAFDLRVARFTDDQPAFTVGGAKRLEARSDRTQKIGGGHARSNRHSSASR